MWRSIDFANVRVYNVLKNQKSGECMDWFDIKNNPNVKVVTEQNYRGFEMKWVENKGWKIVLGEKHLEEEYLFPTFQDAKYAVDRIHDDLVKKYHGVKLKTKA